ncbi:putative CN hydrolase domain-containing protein [Seiridium cardinale]|uniref:nitrilase n=1 Tax=Seiridium cardinale TaxID=138064 RepID=A0ABR2XWJ9_9PEZI
MASSTVRVAVTQAEPVWLDLQGSVKKVCKLMKEAAENKAQLIAFPECFIPGYPCWIWSRLVDFEMNVKYIKNSLKIDSPEMETIKTAARDNGIAVSLGFSENDDDSLYISQVLIGADGEVKVHRRKMKPTHMERTIFGDASGHCLSAVAQLPFARVGQLSCWEHIQPLLKFNTMAQKEQIHVSAWPSLTPHSGGPDLWSMSAEGCLALSATYAIESTAFVLHSTALITDEGVKTQGTGSGAMMSSAGGGSSAIFGPDGRKLTKPLDDKTEGILYADLDFDEITRIKMFAHCTGHYSRPDLLWLNTDNNIKGLVRSAVAKEVANEITTELVADL